MRLPWLLNMVQREGIGPQRCRDAGLPLRPHFDFFRRTVMVSHAVEDQSLEPGMCPGRPGPKHRGLPYFLHLVWIFVQIQKMSRSLRSLTILATHTTLDTITLFNFSSLSLFFPWPSIYLLSPSHNSFVSRSALLFNSALLQALDTSPVVHALAYHSIRGLFPATTSVLSLFETLDYAPIFLFSPFSYESGTTRLPNKITKTPA